MGETDEKSWNEDYYRYGSQLGPRFGRKPLDEISPFDVERMKASMMKAKNKCNRLFASASIKHALVLLKCLFNLATRWGAYQGPNPCAAVEMPKLDNQVTECLSDEETRRLLKVLDDWPFRQHAAFIRFALFTGCRRGELFKMKWQDVDFDRKLLVLRQPKGGKTETIPLSDEALRSIEALRRKCEYVFPGKGGGMLSDFGRPWYRVRKAAGLPDSFRFHGLRHAFASKLVSSGVDLYAVSRLLTHKQISTT